MWLYLLCQICAHTFVKHEIWPKYTCRHKNEMSKPVENFFVYLSQTDNNCQEAKISMNWENAPKMAVYTLE